MAFSFQRFVCLLALLLAFSPESRALVPGYVSDSDMARLPIIVSGRWLKPDAGTNTSDRVSEANGPDTGEKFERMEVFRSIKGNVKPGVYRLRVDGPIGWNESGLELNSATSTELLGDVDDVTNTNLWFLSWSKSSGSPRKNKVLEIGHYRQIQPLVLEEYFKALGSRHPRREVPKLLNDRHPEVVYRALHFVAGDRWHWPYCDPYFHDFARPYADEEEVDPGIFEASDLVASVMGRLDLPDVRLQAMAVYAWFKGEAACPLLVTFLRDKMPEARDMAFALLAHLRYEAAIDEMIAQGTTATNDFMACAIIDVLREWRDPRLVPVLIDFLQNDNSSCSGDHLAPVLAVKARHALKDLTGHDFPYDAAASLKAWHNVESIPDFDERKRQLAALLPCHPDPLEAELLGDAEKSVIRVRNRSEEIVTITKLPAYAKLESSRFSGGAGFSGNDETEYPTQYVTLSPGNSIQFSVQLIPGLFNLGPDSRKVTLVYKSNGNRSGFHAWVGCVQAVFGKDWAEIQPPAPDNRSR